MEEYNTQIKEQNFPEQRTYEFQNIINNNNMNNPNDLYSSNDYNYQTQNNKFEEDKELFRHRTYTNKFNNLQLSSNNNDNNEDIEMEEIEEDTEQEAVEFIQLQHQKIKKLKKELKI